jgi:hypothetical protein
MELKRSYACTFKLVDQKQPNNQNGLQNILIFSAEKQKVMITFKLRYNRIFNYFNVVPFSTAY